MNKVEYFTVHPSSKKGRAPMPKSSHLLCCFIKDIVNVRMGQVAALEEGVQWQLQEEWRWR